MAVHSAEDLYVLTRKELEDTRKIAFDSGILNQKAKTQRINGATRQDELNRFLVSRVAELNRFSDFASVKLANDKDYGSITSQGWFDLFNHWSLRWANNRGQKG